MALSANCGVDSGPFGERTTTVSGRTILLKDILPKIGVRWDGDARVWKIPAVRTHELY
jgi:hypothetical protein